MKKLLKLALCLLTVALLAESCSSVAFTGRKRVLMYTDDQISALADESYNEFESTAKPSTNKTYTNMVQQVGKRMTSALENYLRSIGQEDYLSGLKWNYELVQSNEVNAFCLPNGKIVFYEGLMKYTNTPDYIAVVMGHEIAHAVARHGNERMSQQSMLSTAGSVLGAVVGMKTGSTGQAIFESAFGIGSQYGLLLPYSRQHEYEADKIGLIIMAMAGYDVDQAPIFWEKMTEGSSSSTPELLSTHPSDANRIKKIMEVIPEAKSYIGK